MELFIYDYLSKNTNALITITVRTDEGREVADFIAHDELLQAVRSEPTSWYVDNVEKEGI